MLLNKSAISQAGFQPVVHRPHQGSTNRWIKIKSAYYKDVGSRFILFREKAISILFVCLIVTEINK